MAVLIALHQIQIQRIMNYLSYQKNYSHGSFKKLFLLRNLFFLFFLTFFINTHLSGQCANSQSAWAGNAVSSANNGGWVSWSGAVQARNTPNNTGTSNNLGTGLASTTRSLYVTGYNLNIPCNAIIDSITFMVIRRNTGTSDVTDNSVTINNPTNQGPAIGSVNMATTDLWYQSTTDWDTVYYSHANWGTTLTPDKINQSGFGLVLTALNTGAASSKIEVDAVEMKVCYSLPSAGAYNLPITYTVDKSSACEGEGAINIQNTAGGNGNYEYSIDDGSTWQTSGSFTNLAPSIYKILVRNTDGSCQTTVIFCPITADDRLLQGGDMLVSCEAVTNTSTTLAIERLTTINDSYTNGDVGFDVSGEYPLHPFEWTYNELGGNVQSTTWDTDLNIYTGLSNLYDLFNLNVLPVVIKIDGITGAITKLDTLPGNVGIGTIEYDTLCSQLFVSNMEDGKIYRLDPNTGNTLSVFDPLNADVDTTDLPPLGERVLGVTFNYNDNRLYYSMWNSDYSNSTSSPNFGVVKNSIRSVAIDPVTCDFLPATDALEIETPWQSELPNPPTPLKDFNVPVFDIEFSDDGQTMLLAEIGYNSSVPAATDHKARILQYTESAGTWTWNSALPTGNTEQMYEIGNNSFSNSRGGVDFALAGLGADGCPIDNEAFIVATMDAALGHQCSSDGCVYGLQYMPIDGANSTNSVLYNISRDIWTQRKGFYGDVDVVHGCLPAYCAPDCELVAITDTTSICLGGQMDLDSIFSISSAGSVTYHTALPATSTNAIPSIIAPTVATTYYASVDTSTCSATDSLFIDVLMVDSIMICNDTTNHIEILAQSGVSNVVWYNSAGTQVGTGGILLVDASSPGMEDGTDSYYYTGADGSGCEVGLCCPIVVSTEDCCKPDICLPFTVTIRRGGRN